MKLLPARLVVLTVLAAAVALTGWGASAAAPPHPASTFSPAASLLTGRASGFAVLLPDGDIFAGSGVHLNKVQASTEIYHLATNTWTPTASSPVQPRVTTAVLLHNGMVFRPHALDLGVDGYDPLSDVWSPLASATQGTTFFSTTVLADGKVYAIECPTSECLTIAGAEIYDPAADTWSAATAPGALIDKPGYPGISQPLPLADGRLLLFGTSPLLANEAAIYDPAADSWVAAAPVPDSHDWSSAVVLHDGRVLVTGGADLAANLSVTQAYKTVKLYDPATDNWSNGADMHLNHGMHQSVVLSDGTAMILSPPDPLLGQSRVEIYDPVANTWHETDNLPQFQTGGVPLALPGGELLYVGSTNAFWSARVLLYGADTDGDGYNDFYEGQLDEDASTYCPIMRADVTPDGRITSGDLGYVAVYFGANSPPRPDQNGDNRITSADLGIDASYFAKATAACP